MMMMMYALWSRTMMSFSIYMKLERRQVGRAHALPGPPLAMPLYISVGKITGWGEGGDTKLISAQSFSILGGWGVTCFLVLTSWYNPIHLLYIILVILIPYL